MRNDGRVNLMNENIKRIADESGFCFWGDESWKPDGAIIDWSCIYDREFKAFTYRLIEEINRINYEDESLTLDQKVELENTYRRVFGVE